MVARLTVPALSGAAGLVPNLALPSRHVGKGGRQNGSPGGTRVREQAGHVREIMRAPMAAEDTAPCGWDTIVVMTRGDSGLAQRAQLDLADEALGALRDHGGNSVGHVIRRQSLGWVFTSWAGKFGNHAARANHRYAYAVASQVFGHAGGQAMNTPLGSAIQPAAGKGVVARQRADVDNVPGPATNHGGHDGAGHQEDTLQIGVQHALPIGFGLFMSGAEKPDAGVVNQDRDGSKSGLGFGNNVGNVCEAADVGGARENSRSELAQLGGRGFQGFAVASANGHRRSEPGEAQSDGPTNTATPASHQCDPVRERRLIWTSVGSANHGNSLSSEPLILCETHHNIVDPRDAGRSAAAREKSERWARKT